MLTDHQMPVDVFGDQLQKAISWLILNHMLQLIKLRIFFEISLNETIFLPILVAVESFFNQLY